MSIFLAALLLAPLAKQIDTGSLDALSRAERDRALIERAGSRRGAQLFEPATLMTVCRAAAGERNPRLFLAQLSRAYDLPASDIMALNASCAAYMAGLAEGRR